MSEIIQIRRQKNQAFTFSAIRHVLLSQHTSLHVLMITWHQWAAVSCWEAYKK